LAEDGKCINLVLKFAEIEEFTAPETPGKKKGVSELPSLKTGKKKGLWNYKKIFNHALKRQRNSTPLPGKRGMR